jgi:hypothetical protein
MRIAFTQSRVGGTAAAGGDRPALPVGRLALAATLLALLSIVAPASADVGTTIINRCTHGQSLSGFSQQDYRRALQELPTEVEEYSDCGNLIRRAQLAAAGGGGSSAGAATAIATPLTPAERSALKRVRKAGSAPLLVGGELVHPGVVHAGIASALSSLPNPLLAILAFLLACALLLAGRALRNRVRTRRSS